MLRKIYHHLVEPKLALLAASRAASRLGLQAFQVAGANMAPTIPADQIVWFRPLASLDGLKRGSLLAVRFEAWGGVLIPTRLVGLPGETVELRGGQLRINGEPIAEPYMDPQRAEQDYSRDCPPVTVPREHVWLLGDFRDMSKDSRHLGPVPASAIAGQITHAHRPGQHTQAEAVQ